MDGKREQAWVGLFVLIAAALLIGVTFSLSGAWGAKGNTYHASFKFAGGLEPGAVVRYSGGPKVGRVEQLRVDPKDSARIEITFSVKEGTPVKTDSVAKITSLSALGDNYMEITPGSPTAPLAPPGSALKGKDYFGIADLSDTFSEVAPEARKLIADLNARVNELKETIVRVNDLLNEKNRVNVSTSLAEVRGMLEENRPRVKSTLANVDKASAKIEPLMDDFKKAVADADRTLNNVDTLLQENRPDIRAAITQLRQTLASASEAVDQVNRTLNYNAENIDEILENMRHTTENLKQFTDTIKSRPSTLLRSSGPPERRPGTAPKPK